MELQYIKKQQIKFKIYLLYLIYLKCIAINMF